MKSQNYSSPLSGLSSFSVKSLILLQFFLIIFIYHTMKDLKDSVVITASDAGAEVIPFIKIWGMLPIAIGASYLFGLIYTRFGREKTLYIFVGILLSAYFVFSFLLYPLSDVLYLENLSIYLKSILPQGCKGLIAMICYWHYTFFYLSAELWSLLILSILFWGYVNSITTLSEAAKFYPLCMFVGNFAGIISGQISHYLSHHLTKFIAWESILQLITLIVIFCGFLIMGINRILSKYEPQIDRTLKSKKPSSSSFKENLIAVGNSVPLLCIAILVVGFGLTSNLIEVVWKENIRKLYPSPQAYNAYINQLTSLIGFLAVVIAFVSRWLCQNLSWRKIALITPITLFITSSLFFAALLFSEESLTILSKYLGMNSLFFIVLLGSIHYVFGMTAKYTLFDTTKEMAFLSIKLEERIRAKSVIDSIGSRLGKSGASCLYQFLLIAFGSTSGHISIIGLASISMIAISIIATNALGSYLSTAEDKQSDEEYAPKLAI